MFLGGSITAGSSSGDNARLSFRALTSKAIYANWSLYNVLSVDSGVGAHSSAYGALRLRRDVLDYAPGIVVIDFAANDNGSASISAIAEANIRRIRAELPEAKLLFIAFGHVADHLVNDPTNVNQAARDQWDAICGHYDIPIVDWWSAMTALVESEENVVSDFLADYVHPSPAGHQLAADLLIPELPQSILDEPSQWSGDIDDYERLFPDSVDYEHESFEVAANEAAETGSGWVDYGTAGRQSSTPGDTISFSGEFRLWGMDVNYGAGAGMIEYSVNGGEFVAFDLSSRSFPIRVFPELAERGAHSVTVRVVSGLVQIEKFLAI